MLNEVEPHSETAGLRCEGKPRDEPNSKSKLFILLFSSDMVGNTANATEEVMVRRRRMKVRLNKLKMTSPGQSLPSPKI